MLSCFQLLGGGMTRNRGPASQLRGGPRPVGWREIVNPNMSRRSFLGYASTAPLLAESALAQPAAPSAPPEMALEFDLSEDGLPSTSGNSQY